jgi:hypothetical protein
MREVNQVKVAVAHTIPERSPIRLAVGEQVVVGKRDSEWPEFVFVTIPTGAGWVPAHHLSRATGVADVLEEYDTTELPTEVGEVLEVVREDLRSGWLWCRSPAGREGWLPVKTVVREG